MANPPPPYITIDPLVIPRADLSTCVPKYSTAQDFLDLWDRLLPFEYIEPMKDPGPGYEIFQGMAAMFERLSLAAGRVECSLFIGLSHGAFKSVGTVEFFRENDLNGAFTIKAGTRVRASSNNREFVLLSDVPFGANDLTASATVEARQADWQFDLPGPKEMFGESAPGSLEGEIDEVNLPLLDPPYAEPTIQVRQIADTEQGQPATLDLHGKDRSIFRLTGEADTPFRNRIKSTPDTVSPAALVRQLDELFDSVGATYEFFEAFENRFQSCWNAPESAPTSFAAGPFQPNLFVYNDPRTGDFNNRWLGSEHTGACIVIVVPPTFFGTFGFAYDDSAAVAGGVPANRGIPAYDASGAGSYDGEDLAAARFFLRVWDVLRKIKPSGMTVVLEVNQDL